MAPMQITPQPTIDFWNNPCPWPEIDTMTDTDNLTGFAGPRVAEDVVLSNVIGFDVKVWSPWALDPRTGTQGAYVDLGYGTKPDDPLASSGHAKSYLPSLAARGFIYDTWSTHYEHDGIDQDQGMDNGAGVDQGTNGFDDVMVGTTATNGIDDVTERETMPPYPVPLRGIQVKIRSYEPTTRQIRETTVVQDFLPK